MNRRSALQSTLLAVVSLCCAAAPVGCRSPRNASDLARVALACRNIQEIEPLELKEAPPEPEAPPADVNVPPPASLELSLPECRALALENNLQLKAQLISPTIAAAQLNAEEAKFGSSFFANFGLMKTDDPVASRLAIEGFQRDYTYEDLGVQIPLRTGGTITFEGLDARTKSDSEWAIFNPEYNPDLSASISHPLLRNAGRWINTHSIRIASYNRDITSARTKLEITTVLAALDRVYWRLYAARKELEVREQQYQLAQALLEQARRLVEAGERAQVEVIRAEAGVAQQLEAIIIAENNLRDRERELKRTINRADLSMQTPTVVVPVSEPDPVRYALERSRLIRTAIGSRMELLELQLQLLQDASSVDFAENQTLPLASLDYRYNINGLGGTRNDAWDLIFNNEFAGHRVGLQVTIPIGNEAAKSRLRQAIYQRRQRLATRANREDLIKLEVLNAADQAEANWQRILAARQNTILNARLYDAERRQFEIGLNTSTDVLNAQINFANAQSAEIAALTEYQIALVDLAYATGTLLGADRIHWDPVVPEADPD